MIFTIKNSKGEDIINLGVVFGKNYTQTLRNGYNHIKYYDGCNHIKYYLESVSGENSGEMAVISADKLCNVLMELLKKEM